MMKTYLRSLSSPANPFDNQFTWLSSAETPSPVRLGLDHYLNTERLVYEQGWKSLAQTEEGWLPP